MSHVRAHTRQAKNGTQRVRAHSRDDDGATFRGANDGQESPSVQRARHQFEGRVFRERQAAEARYHHPMHGKAPGERKPKRKPQRLKPARAQRNLKKAWRARKRHKVLAVRFAVAGLGELGAFTAHRGGRAVFRASRSAWRASAGLRRRAGMLVMKLRGDLP